MNGEGRFRKSCQIAWDTEIFHFPFAIFRECPMSASELKEKGNALFRSGKLREARSVYVSALSTASNDNSQSSPSRTPPWPPISYLSPFKDYYNFIFIFKYNWSKISLPIDLWGLRKGFFIFLNRRGRKKKRRNLPLIFLDNFFDLKFRFVCFYSFDIIKLFIYFNLLFKFSFGDEHCGLRPQKFSFTNKFAI